MTETFYIKRGDTGPSIRFSLEPATITLIGAEVAFQMRVRGGGQVIDAPAVIENFIGTPTVRYDWRPSDTAAAGLFEAEVRVRYANGVIETFPNSGFVLIRIGDDIRAA
jgi:hypothetical protein